MQSDPGAGTPHTGDDDEVWRELVARLEESDDEFLIEDHDHLPGKAPSGTPPISNGPSSNRPPGNTPLGDDDDPRPAKGVVDFDPLGVWQQQFAPAPQEPSAEARTAADPAPGAPSGPRDYAAPDDLDEKFVPAELPSLRSSEPAVVLAWIGAAGGPLFLLFAAILWRGIPMFFVVAVVVAFVVGTGYLLYRLPNNRDHNDGDGAVV